MQPPCTSPQQGQMSDAARREAGIVLPEGAKDALQQQKMHNRWVKPLQIAQSHCICNLDNKKKENGEQNIVKQCSFVMK